MKKTKQFLRLLPILFALVWSSTASGAKWDTNRNTSLTSFSSFPGGGTSSNPYTISNAKDFAQFAYLVNIGNDGNGMYFKITADINLSGYEWVPIGYNDRQFRGILDGGGYTISNMNINMENDSDRGLVGVLSGSGRLQNIIMTNVTVKGASNCGAFIGTSHVAGAALRNCHVQSGDIIGWNVCGGLIGLIGNGATDIYRCSSGATVNPRKNTEHNQDSGGLVGKIGSGGSDCDFFSCLFYGKLSIASLDRMMGGLVGYMESGAKLYLYETVMNGTLSLSPSTTNGIGIMVGGAAASTTLYLGARTSYQSYSSSSTAILVGSNSSTISSKPIYTSSSEMNTNDFAHTLNAATTDSSDWIWSISGGLRNDRGVYTRKITKPTTGSNISTIDGYSSSTIYTTSSSVTVKMSSSGSYKSRYGLKTSTGSLTYKGNNNYTLSFSTPTVSLSSETINLPYADNLNVDFNQWDKKITLNWTHKVNGSSVTGKYYVYRKVTDNGSTSSWTPLTSLATSVSSYTETVDYDKSYQYGLSFVETAETIPSTPTQIHVTEKDTALLRKDTAPIVTVDNFTVTGTDKAINLSFEITNNLNSGNTANTYTIWRKKNSEEYKKLLAEQTFKPKGTGASKYTYKDENDLGTSCDSLTYKVTINAFSREFTSKEENSRITGESKLTAMKATKGEHNNMVRIAWSTEKLKAGQAERYKVFRTICKREGDQSAYAESDWAELATINTSDADYSYMDDKALPGVYYNYKITLYQECGTSYIPLNELEDVGFAQSLGTVSGRITYGSGTAVEGVNVLVKRNDLEGSETQYRSLTGDGGGSRFVWDTSKDYYNSIFGTGDFSYQFWLRPQSNNVGHIATIANRIKVELLTNASGGYKLKLSQLSGSTFSLTTTAVIPENTYSHIALVRKGTELSCYIVNDADLDNVSLQKASISAFPASLTTSSAAIEGISMGYTLRGNIDECRLWSKALSETEILRDYNRMLTGGENNLKAYWTFDEPLDNYAFDISRVGTIYNGNHGTRTLKSSNIVPTESQLALKAITDADGNYQVRGIPYIGEGSSYEIVPNMGIHQFQPSKHLRYISGTSMVHNGTDFSDISSFRVKGSIVYEGTNYPVDSIQINVDGVAANRDGQLIMTDRDGNFEVDVPIGEHFISVSKYGHSFENEGRYPAGIAKHNFQNNIDGLTFYDNTKIRVVGRVSGGEIESGKEIGFGLSKANVGKATVRLMPQREDYSLNYEGETPRTSTAVIGGKTITTVIENEAKTSRITIETDAETGEFIALLPPVPYKITNVATKKLAKDKFTYSSVELFNPTVNMVQTAEYTHENGTTETFNYHQLLNIVHRSEPRFSVTDKGNSYGAFGDSVYVYSDEAQGLQENIKLYTVSGGNVDYTLGAPVFSKMKRYDWDISAYEPYENHDGDEVVTDIVPLKELEIRVDNALASLRVDINETTSNATISHEENIIQLNEKGKATYAFVAGFPNLSGDNCLAAKMSFDHNGRTITWPEASGSGFMGIVVGDVPSNGNNFITEGPDLVDYIIRDPAGSSSSAYLERGSVISTEHKISNKLGTSLESKATMKLGGEQSIATGVGVAIIIETKANLDASVGLESEMEVSSSNTAKTSTELTQRIATSDSPDYVGTMADIYIGSSTNLLYGLVRNLGFYPAAGAPDGALGTDKYKLFNKEILSAGINLETSFTYTQDYILNILIPNIEDNRNSKLQSVKTIPAINVKTITEPCYYTTLNPQDENFGTEGTYTAFMPQIKGKVFVDQIQEYNNWIASWRQTIADNERAKVEMFANGKAENKSFDAGATIEASTTKTTTSTTEFGTSWNIKATVGLESGFEVAGIGFELSAETGLSTGGETTETNENESSINTGYTLADDSRGDAYSIDVYAPAGNGGYIFRTRAGQTACPFEAEERTLFYEAGEHILNYGTFQIEKPSLLIDNMKEASAENIPSGREATFTIQMANESEAKQGVTYQLGVADDSNSEGLKLIIDGTPLTEPRLYYIEYGNTIEKTLKVSQSSLDKLKYEDIVFQLASTCDGNIVSEASISVDFISSSTPLKLKSNSTLVNNVSANNIKFTISEYDRKFKNFASVRLQYKNVYSHEWTTIHEFINDVKLIPVSNPANQTVFTADEIEYNYAMDLTDGTYDFRAISVSINGNEEITISSEEIRVIKDMKTPQLLGRPMPSGGVLYPDDEISIVFNEDIRTAYISASDISVKGILNGHKIAHNTAAQFAGGAPASTGANISLAERSFSIEAWFKRNKNEAGTLFAHGRDFSLGFNAANNVVITIAGETFTSTGTLTDENWQYISFAYDKDGKYFNVYSLSGSETKTVFNVQTVANPYMESGRLYIGAKADGSAAFTGAIHDLSLWNKTRFITDLSDRDEVKSGNEKALASYWTLTEGNGTVASDKARNRHITMPSANNWYLNNVNKAVSFNGTSNYLSVSAADMPVSADESFALEFWFKGNAQSNASLFSCGEGSAAKVSINFDADGKLNLCANGSNYKLSDNNYLDNSWHHFALNAMRSGSVTAYVDGESVKQLPNSIINGMAAASYVFGAHDSGNQVFTKYFKGAMDDIRIWKADITAEVIRQNIYNRLNGDEDGLLAYFPFEETKTDTYGQTVTESTLKDCRAESLKEATGTATASNEAPALKEARTLENVSHIYTTSNNKVVITITEPMSRIENCMLEFTVRNVLDLNNNTLAQPIRWNAYVNMNQLKWSDDEIVVSKEYLEEATFAVSISNQSGKDEKWVISNVPSWLKASKTSGTLKPLTTQKLTFTADSKLAVGNYEEDIFLSGNNFIDEKLPVVLRVTAQKPDWSVNPADFELSMNLIGQLKFEGTASENTEDILAAFIDDECVGIASPEYQSSYDAYFINMDIYGNAASANKAVAFRAWSASTGEVSPSVHASKEITFTGDQLVGKWNDPVIFNTDNFIEQTISLSEGWNWISVHVNAQDMSLDNVLSKVSGNTELVKGKLTFAVPYEESWNGELATVEMAKMYKMKMKASDKLNIVGEKANPANVAITIQPNWNWIGYTPQQSLFVDDALAELEAAEDDLIKTQSGFAVYTANGWLGSLKSLEPGRGYMYQSQATQNKSFAFTAVSASRRMASVARISETENYWNIVAENRYANNMTMIAKVVWNNNEAMSNSHVGLFAGEECRGGYIAKEDGYAFITIAGDEQQTPLSIKVYDPNTGKQYSIEETINYVDDAMVGSMSNPYMIVVDKLPTGNGLLENSGISVYPTLVTTNLNVASGSLAIERVIITDMSGRTIKIENNVDKHSNTIDVSGLAGGVYFVTVETNMGEAPIVKIVKQ